MILYIILIKITVLRISIWYLCSYDRDTKIIQQRISNKKMNKLMVDFAGESMIWSVSCPTRQQQKRKDENKLFVSLNYLGSL